MLIERGQVCLESKPDYVKELKCYYTFLYKIGKFSHSWGKYRFVKFYNISPWPQRELMAAAGARKNSFLNVQQ